MLLSWLQWWQSLMSTQMIGFTLEKGPFFQSNYLSSPLVLYTRFSYLSMLLIILIAARPRYRNKKGSNSSDYSVKRNSSVQGRLNSIFAEAPAMLVPSLTSSRSVREAIQEVKMVQVCFSLSLPFCLICKILTNMRNG